MSREIKFRAKDIKTNKWVYGGYYKHQKRTPCPINDTVKDEDYECLIIRSGFSDWNMPKLLEYILVDESTVGQFTGLKDKNDKEIYEGDVVKFSDCYGDFTGVVCYYDDCKPIIERHGRSYIDIAECNKEDLEVIGNKEVEK